MKWDKAKQAIEEAHSIDELKNIRDKAEALRLYVKQQKESLGVQNKIAEIKLRCERRIGEMTQAMPKAQGARTDLTSTHEALKSDLLKEAGLRQQQVSKFEIIAAVPEDKFEEHIAAVQAKNEELTSIKVLEFAKDFAYQVGTHTPPPKDSPQEKANGIIKDVNRHLMQITNLLQDIPLRDATPTLIKVLSENGKEFLLSFSTFQETLATFIKDIEEGKVPTAPDFPLGETDPQTAIEIEKYREKLRQMWKESPKAHAIPRRILSLRVALAEMPLSKISAKHNKQWVIEAITQLQEILNEYVVKDITPLTPTQKTETKVDTAAEDIPVQEGEVV